MFEKVSARISPGNRVRIRKTLRLLGWGLLTWLVIRAFFFQGVRIPSASMNGTLVEGDYVLVNKMAYGARLPITPLALPVSGSRFFLDWIQLPYLRLPGYADISRNDVLVFNLPSDDNLPVDQRQLYIKRCVALPGDTFSIVAGEVYINSRQLPAPAKAQKKYTAYAAAETGIPPAAFASLGLVPESKSYNPLRYTLIMNAVQAESLRKSEHVAEVKPVVPDSGYYSPVFFPNDSRVRWSGDFFGPVVIPQEGKTVKINLQNLPLYRRIIEKYEGHQLAAKNDSIFIDGKNVAQYTFTLNYYFVLGDNRPDSQDSRSWGFLPEDHITGKASVLLFSGGNAGDKGRSFSIIR
ncbi:MAG: signal peptidase I [Bacteroidetes bacterium]|nr:MAG: signal peptidase I [Bacteroidota bacterium]